MKKFWLALERSIDQAAVTAAWRSMMGDEFPLGARFLLPTQRLAESIRCLKPRHHCIHEIRLYKGEYLCVCPDGCDTVVLSRKDVVIHRLDVATLGREVAAALGLEAVKVEEVPTIFGLWHIGNYTPSAGFCFPVYATFTGESDRFRSIVEGLSARRETFILTAPARTALRQVTADLLKISKSCFLLLMELIGHGNDGQLSLLDGYTADTLFAEFRAAHVPQPKTDDRMAFFPTPAGAGWHDVSIHFIDRHSVYPVGSCLLDAAERAEPPIEIVGKPAPTPGDVAVQVWLKNRELLESKHAEQFTESVRSFYSFGSAVMPVPRPRDPVAVIDEIKNDLDDFFEKKKRDRHTKIFPYIQDDSTMFLVRHGDPFERKSTITERGDSAGVYYWPEKFDVLVLDPVGGELRIHARSKGEVDEYRRVFGRHLYSGGFFSVEDVYTLEPLQTIGEDSITPICGMERVVLIEAHFSWGNRRHTSVTQKDPDIFAAYRTGILQPPIAARITKARFRITFTGSPKPRTVTIKLPNEAQYMRDDDGVIVERWLRERGFIVKPGKMKTGQAPHEPTHYDPAA